MVTEVEWLASGWSSSAGTANSPMRTASPDCVSFAGHADVDGDPRHITRLCCVQGGALVAPVLGLWYGQLNTMITGTGVGSAIAKTVLDQGFFAPVFVALFISSLLMLDRTPELIGAKLRQDLAPTVVANWALWIPGQLFNFYFVPPSLNLLCSNCISLVWCTYLSWAANRRVQQEKP